MKLFAGCNWINLNGDFLFVVPKSGSFTTMTGTYVFEPVKYYSENHSFNPKYKLRKVKYEGKFPHFDK